MSKKYQPVVQELSDRINDPEHQDLKDAFDQAISDAHKTGVAEVADIDTIDKYLQKIDDWLRWIPKEDAEGKDVYNWIVTFYFIVDQPSLKPFQDPISPGASTQEDKWLTAWLKRYAVALGEFLDTPESAKEIESFYSSPNYNMGEYIKPRGGWNTFNDFFARSFKPGYRPVADVDNSKVIVSPADSTFGGYFEIRSDSGVTIKSLHWRIDELLQGSPYANEFNGGIFTHAFLGPNDYHRQHTPVAGRVLEARNIPGDVYLEVNVVRLPEEENGSTHTIVASRAIEGVSKELDAPDNPGYQFAQARGLIVIKSAIGLVAILPMGMAQVSSVVITAEEGMTLRKGEEISYFQFGGSDIVTVFQANSNVSVLARPGVHYRMGQRIAEAFPVE